MIWQDLVFSGGSIIFIFALLRSILGDEKPEVFTSILYGLVLLVFAYTYETLDFRFSSILTSIIALEWLILAIQEYKHRKKTKI